MHDAANARKVFLAVWLVASVIKVVIAARLPLFVDEAFYWQEGRHLAAAYSDLPGLTAWLTRLGTELGGQHRFALRAPFLIMAALIPWLIAHITRRWFDETAGWQAGTLTVLMPLSGTLGLLALPDVPMALAAVLCLDAGARLLREVDSSSAAELALGLAIGALSHYRFLGVIGVGFIALLCLPEGRRLLRDPRIWIALAVGVAAWAPLLAWNLEYADAGLRFQLVDRHPWSFQPTGGWFVIIQALMVTPLLFATLMIAGARACRDVAGAPRQWRYFGLLGMASTLGFFVLGFFADVERVSFHWPLPGYLALMLAVPALIATWPRFWRRALWALAGVGMVAMLAYYLVASVPAWRERFAAEKYYPYNFAGWLDLAAAVREERARLPAGTTLLAGSFKVGAELGFALDDPDIRVLDHPLNRKHGRAPQLQLWRLQDDGTRDTPVLLVIGHGDVQYKYLLDYYHRLCRQVGPLPPPRVVNIDHGHQRFLLFALPKKKADGPCVAPAMAWIDTPVSRAEVPSRFPVQGWAFKEGVGLKGVDVLIDGKPVARAGYGRPEPGVAAFWRISNDPQHPRVGFRAEIDASALPPGRHWLGLRLHGNDGSREDWEERPIDIQP